MLCLRFIILLSAIFLVARAYSYPTSYIEKDFDESMCIQDQAVYGLMLRSKYSKDYLDFYRKLYNANLPSKIPYATKPKIPKIMHRLWIGPKKMPSQYKKYDENCKKLHPDWKHMFWTEKEISKLNIKFKDFYNSYGLSDSPSKFSAQKDIVLHEVLYKYGGVFMDTDFDCIKKMDELNHKYDFYASLEPPVSWSKIPVQTIAIIASKPKNKILSESLKEAYVTYKRLNSQDVDALQYCNEIVATKAMCAYSFPQFVLMHSLAKTLKEGYKKGDLFIVFPASYFNSVFPRSADNYSLFERIFMVDLKIKKNDPYCFKSIKEESIAVQDFKD